MRNPTPAHGRPQSILRAYLSILAIIFVVDQANMVLIDHDWDWHTSLPEAACLTAICVPLLWFLAFLPLRRALAQQQAKTTQLEAAHAELAFIHDAFQEAESNYHQLFENSTIGLYQMNAIGELLTVNPTYVDLLGYETRGAALQSDHAAAYVLPGRHREMILCADQNGEVSRYESQVRRRDGQMIWVCENLRPSRDAAGNLRFYDGTLQDITERKLAEEADAASRNMLQSIIDNLPQFIFWKDINSVYLGCNNAFARLVGLDTSGDVVGCADEDLFPREVAEGFRRTDCRVMEADTPTIGFTQTWVKDGVTHRAEASKIPLHGADGRVVGLLGTATDITERVRREEHLRESEATLRRTNSMLRAQQEATLDGILIIDEDQRLVSFNSRYCQMWDIPAAVVAAGDEATVLRHISALLPDPGEFIDRVRYLTEHPEEYAEDEIHLNDGRILERYAAPVTAEDGQNNGRVLYFRDVTARRQAEEELRESEAMLHRTNSMLLAQQEATLDSILIVDENKRIVNFNRRFCELWGIPDDMIATHKSGVDTPLLHWAVGQVADPDTYLEKVQHLYAHPHEWSEDEILLRDGRVFERSSVPVIAADGRSIGRIWYNRDITARKRAEEELRESEAMLYRQNSLLLAQQEANLDGLLIVDENKRIVSFNQRFCEMLEVPAALAGLGDDAPVLRHVLGQMQDPDAFLRRVDYLYAHREERSHDEMILRDGRIFERRSVPVSAQDGRSNGRVWQFRDVTERKRAEEDLRASREMLRLVMDSVPQNIFWKDINSVYLGCNRAFADGAGLTSPEDIIGRTDYDLPWPREDADRFRELDRSVMDADAPQLHVPETWGLPGGRIVTAETSKVPLHDAEGRVVGILGTNEDITDRIRAQEALRSSQEMLLLVMDSVPQNILWKNRAGVILGCNQSLARLHGLTVSEMVGQSLQDLRLHISKEETLRLDQADDRVMADDQAQYHVIESLVLPNGEQKWSDFSKIPLHDVAGNVTGLLISFEDVTERKRAEGERLEREVVLHRQNSLLLAQQEATLDGVLIIDENRRVLRINRRFCEMFHVPDEIVAAGDDTLVMTYTVAQYLDPVACTRKIEALYGDTQERSQEELPLRDGRIFERRSVPVTAQDGRSNGRVWYFRDVTEQKLSEEALRQAKDQAEAASRAKSQFLANMSHELRTPMNAVIGFSEILQDQAFGPLNPRQSKYVGNILNSGRHLLQLINDILDITKIEAGRMTLDREPLAVAEAVEGVHSVIKALSMKKKIEILLEIEDRLPVVHADSACFKQILYNLFSNAIKFTPEGGRIRADVRSRDAMLHVAVTDTGIGIAPEDQARIWGEFEQVDSTYARTQQGTGLGLSLTRRLVELHGGRIWMESAGVGHGCVFQFTIPIGCADAPDVLPAKNAASPVTPAPAAAPAEESAPWVLLVDDDSQASDLMTHYLEEEGYAVSRADDGEQAVFLALLSRPCAILLDIEMPGKDGWAVLSELKADARTQDIPVVIVSVEQDRPRALRLGAEACFTKPVDRTALVNALRRIPGTIPGDSPLCLGRRESHA